MALSITGYVLEPPRVGGSNSPFTFTPNNLISNQGAFNTAFPSSETAPRVEYCAFVLNDTLTPGTGPNSGRSLADARLAWTKNEVIQRFDYLGRDGRFKPLPGSGAVIVGQLGPDSNMTRLKVDIPLSQSLASYPIRVSVGAGSGVTFPVTLVVNDAAFTTPGVGAVQLSLSSGHLNWNPTDLSTGGQVRFQRQTFYPYAESTGRLGMVSEVVLLSPLPVAGQSPLIRIGGGQYLTPVQRATDAAFSANPVNGTVEWSVATGRLKFNSGVLSTAVVSYDGVVFGFNVSVPVVSLGGIASPSSLSPIPSEDSDVFFRISGGVQFPTTQFVDTLTTPGKKGVVQIRRSTGQVQFSDDDKAAYAAQTVQAVLPDLAIERGLTLRLFRSPVNPEASNASVKDLTAFYSVTEATLANPIIGSTTVSLPAVPTDSSPITVEVKQGTGTFVGTLPRLDVLTPPVGIGYVFDFDKRELIFAERKSQVVVPAPTAYGGASLGDPLLFPFNLEIELETVPNSGSYDPLVLDENVQIDYPSGLVTFVETKGVVVLEGSTGSITGNTFSATGVSFTAVSVGSYLNVLTGAAKGVYRIEGVTPSSLTLDVSGIALETSLTFEVRSSIEVLADRYFYDIPVVDPNTRVEKMRSLGPASNSPRLVTSYDTLGRVRLGTVTATVVEVANDGVFTAPVSLGSGQVEVSLATGHLNFSQTDVGTTAFASQVLEFGIDYVLQPALGFIQLTDRLLANDEVYVIYKDADGAIHDEQVSFLVSKELVDHPIPANVLSFNLQGKRVAEEPPPRVYRGGRPQASSQVSFNLDASTVAFLSASTITDALPSGPIIDPSERVYVDYYVYTAFGGEQTFSILKPPMAVSRVVVSEDATSFTLDGDRTAVFQANTFLVLNHSETYALQSSVYSSGITTVTLASGQAFRSDLTNPTLSLSSGPILDTYFVTEVASRETIPRGMSRFKLVGDHSRRYVEGVLVLFTDGVYRDYYYVSSSKYDGTRTEVTLLTNSLRQYSDTVALKRSVRLVRFNPPTTFTTTNSLASPEIQVFRKQDGLKGGVLTPGLEYTLDPAGSLTLSTPLTLNELLGVSYTGHTLIDQGRRLRASYTCVAVPTASNGLLNQVLRMSYSTYQPDSFFWRVETMTNFRGELAEAYAEAAKSGSPTSGPILENAQGTPLYKQGRESLFFPEGFLKNEDLVARNTLGFYNGVVNDLETILGTLEDRVVGDYDGPFLFDGLIDNPARATFPEVTNQIDDRFKVSPAPYTVVGPPFVATSIGTYEEVYKPSPTSRFYPTTKKCFGVVIPGVVGSPMLDLGVSNLTSVVNIRKRSPWAVVMSAASAAAVTLTVDDANGSNTLLRPSFQVGMKVAIQGKDGTVYISDAGSLTVTSVSATTLGVSALPVNVPAGATVRLASNDTVYARNYRLGVDLGVDLERGLLTYVDAANAWGGLTNPPTPPTAGEVLDVTVTFTNIRTEPYRFPALDGLDLNDDGDQGLPILSSGTVDYEGDLLVAEAVMVQTLTSLTRPPFVGSGFLTSGNTAVNSLSGTFPSPMPALNDLLGIHTGVNASTVYRRVISAGLLSIGITPSYPIVSATPFNFSVSVADILVTGLADTGSSTVNLLDSAVNFSSVSPGHTVVMLSGANATLRRQVVSVPTSTQLVVEAFPSPIANGDSYKVVNSLGTFGGPNSVVASLTSNLNAQISFLTEAVSAYDSFFNAVLSPKKTGSNGQVSGTTFTAIGQDFQTSGVLTSYLIYIPTGSNVGLYRIQSVLSETLIQTIEPFPVVASGLEYQVVQTSGLSLEFLKKVLVHSNGSKTRLTQVTSFRDVLTTTLSVSSDPGAYITRMTGADVTAETSSITTRIPQVDQIRVDLEANLASGARLYDARFVWVDARINLETGILPRKERSVAQRQKNLAQAVNQMTKLLSVED